MVYRFLFLCPASWQRDVVHSSRACAAPIRPAGPPGSSTNPLKQVLDAVGESVECVQYKKVSGRGGQAPGTGYWEGVACG